MLKQALNILGFAGNEAVDHYQEHDSFKGCEQLVTVRRSYGGRLIPKETHATELIPVLAANPGCTKKQAGHEGCEAKPPVYLIEGNCLGSAFRCEPMVGMDQDTEERFTTLLNNEMPGGSSLQFILFRSPDITSDIIRMRMMRDGDRDADRQQMVQARADHLLQGTETPIDGHTGVRVSNLELIITCKIPYKGSKPSQKDIATVETLAHKLMSNASSAGIDGDFMQPAEYLRFMSSVMNWGETASWRNEIPEYNDNEPIYAQIFDYDKPIDVSKEGLRFGNKYVKTLSAKRLPNTMYMGDAVAYVGDMMGKNNSIKENFLITVNVQYPEQSKAKESLERKRQWVVNQAYGPMLKFVPVLAEKKASFDLVHHSMNEGNRPVRVSYSMAIFGDSEAQVNSASAQAIAIWSSLRFTMLEDRFVALPVFLNMLPLCQDTKGLADLWRYKSMTADRAVPLLPVFGEWKGTGTPHINLVGRNGQLMNVSFHDSSGAYNFVVAAQSGAGKSFFANNIIESYLSGGKIWAIDVGRSYEKLCEVLDGDFIHFGEDSEICLNPFDLIRDYADEEDAIIGILSAMAAPNDPLSDWQRQILKKSTLTVWEAKGNSMIVDDVEAQLLRHEDRRARDLADQLHSFTSRGAYGRFFNGRNNLRLTSNFTVLELEELKGRTHLQQVVLLQLIYQIQNEVYLAHMEDRAIKKLVLIDEAWDLLTKGDVGDFVEHGYRRFRKYGGFIGVITQSLMDLTDHRVGRVIQDNSPTTILLRQNRDTIKKLKKEGTVNYTEAEFRLLSSVHTVVGAYSEMFIKSEFGTGVGRLIVSDIQKLLYTTNPDELAMIQQYKNRMNCGALEAIKAILADKQQRFIG